MRRIRAVGAITAILIMASIGWTVPPSPAAKNAPAKAPTPSRQDVAKSLELEQKSYLERLQFCTRLRQIAAETGDDKLIEKADFLEEQATKLYLRKTSTLNGLVEDIKAAEAHLEERRNNPTPVGSAANNGRGRAPNGRPVGPRE